MEKNLHLGDGGRSGAAAEGEGIDACPEFNRRGGLKEDDDIKPKRLMLDVIDVILEFDKGIFFGGAVALPDQLLRLHPENAQLNQFLLRAHNEC